MTGGEGEPMVHLYAFYQRQLGLRHKHLKPCHRTRGIDDMLEDLRGERR